MINLKECDITRLEQIVSAYPYFAYAKEVLICRLAESDREAAKELLAKNSAYLHSAGKLFAIICESERNSAEQKSAAPETKPVAGGVEEAMESIISEQSAESLLSAGTRGNNSVKEENKTQYILVGADYFSPKELQSVSSAPFKMERIGTIAGDEKGTAMAERCGMNTGLDLSDLYTETLGRIYAEQGYYNEAIKVYSKLILLYPEKSTYFATLINDLKLKN